LLPAGGEISAGRQCWGQRGGGGGRGGRGGSEGGQRELYGQLGVDWINSEPLLQFCVLFLQRCIVKLELRVELLKSGVLFNNFLLVFLHLIDQLFHFFTLRLLFIPKMRKTLTPNIV